jgi:hypothetical protein
MHQKVVIRERFTGSRVVTHDHLGLIELTIHGIQLRVIVNHHNGVGIVPPNGIVRGNPEFIVTGLSEVSENHKHIGFSSDSEFFGFGMRRLDAGIGGGEGGEERGEFRTDRCAEGA